MSETQCGRALPCGKRFLVRYCFIEPYNTLGVAERPVVSKIVARKLVVLRNRAALRRRIALPFARATDFVLHLL